MEYVRAEIPYAQRHSGAAGPACQVTIAFQNVPSQVGTVLHAQDFIGKARTPMATACSSVIVSLNPSPRIIGKLSLIRKSSGS